MCQEDSAAGCGGSSPPGVLRMFFVIYRFENLLSFGSVQIKLEFRYATSSRFAFMFVRTLGQHEIIP
jgi:hypothetical protein